MRPRGVGRGYVSAYARQARYQRYYNRGSNANWKAMKASEEKAATAIAKFVAFTLLVLAGLLIALIAAVLGGHHVLTMYVLTIPLWGGAAIILKLWSR